MDQTVFPDTDNIKPSFRLAAKTGWAIAKTEVKANPWKAILFGIPVPIVGMTIGSCAGAFEVARYAKSEDADKQELGQACLKSIKNLRHHRLFKKTHHNIDHSFNRDITSTGVFFMRGVKDKLCLCGR